MQGYQFKRCSLQGHQIFDAAILCISDQCTSESRIACAKCVKEFHSNHAKECIMMEELMEDKLNQIPQASAELTNKIVSLRKLIEDTGAQDDSQIEEILEEFTNNLLRNVENERINIKTQYKQKQELYGELIQELLKIFNETFNLVPILQELQAYQSGKLNEKGINLKLNAYLRNEDRNEKKNQLANLYKNCVQKLPNLNNDEIKYIREQLEKQFATLGDLVRIPGNWYFIAPQIQSYNVQLKTQQGGTLVEFGNAESQQFVYSSQPMKFPHYHQWTLKIEEQNTGMNYNTVYVGIVVEQYKEDMNQMFSYGKSVYLDLNNNGFTQFVQQKPNTKTMGVVIKENTAKKQPTYIQFLFDTKNKSLIIQDSEELSKYEYSKKLIKKQSGAQQNNYNMQQHMGFYKQQNSFRTFVMNYSAQFKVTIE